MPMNICILRHSSSEMLDLYYHLHDEDSQNAMAELAKSDSFENAEIPSEGNLRAMGEYKIVKALQVPEIKELMECLINTTEKAGFEPAVRKNRTQPFQGCTLSHSDTSPGIILVGFS